LAVFGEAQKKIPRLILKCRQRLITSQPRFFILDAGEKLACLVNASTILMVITVSLWPSRTAKAFEERL
jgi:hypothetical protein